MIHFLDSLTETEKRIFGSFVVLAVFWCSRLIAHNQITQRVTDIRLRYKWRQSATLITTGIAMLLIVRIWFEWFSSILTLLSVVAAAITIVSKELLLNFFAYGVIIWRGLFKVGERIQIGTTIGDVIEIGPVYISVAELGNWVSADAASGRVIKVPNAFVLTQPVANYSRGQNLIWNELSVELPITRNWEKARDLLQGFIQEESVPLSEETLVGIRENNEEIIFVRKEPQVFVRVEKKLVIFTMRYLCKFHRKRISEDRLWTKILATFAEHEDLSFNEKS